MTKPRYTPDPLPDGLDPTLAAFLQMELSRLHDLWPKDYEDRVTALERVDKYISGEWPIVDYAYTRFDGSAEEATVYNIYGFMYSNTATSARVTSGDYESFGGTETITGLNSAFNKLIDNEQGQAVAVIYAAADTSIYYTADGFTWSSNNPSAVYGTKGIVWHNDSWVIVGGVTTPNNYGFACISSTDAVNWTTKTTTTARDYEPVSTNALASNGTRLVCACSNYLTGNRVAYSDDNGATWTDYAAPNVEPADGIWYGGGLFFFTCSKRLLYTSSTGESGSWTLRLNVGGTGAAFEQLLYADSRYMLVSNDNNAGAQDYLYTSTDGINWSTGLAIAQINGPWPLSYDDTYGWIFAGDSTLKWSSDGITWNDTNLGAAPFSIRGFLRMKIPA